MLLRHEDGPITDVSTSLSELWRPPRLRGRIGPSKVREALVSVRGAMRALIKICRRTWRLQPWDERAPWRFNTNGKCCHHLCHSILTKEPVAAKNESRACRAHGWREGR